MKRKQDADKSDSDSDSIVELVDVDFEFFDPNPDIDYHAILRLLGQLFQGDAALLRTHELTQLVLDQPLVGTTIKTDGRESDPLALLTVLNMRVHREQPCIQALASYLLCKTTVDTSFHTTLQTLLSPETPRHDLGLVLCERLINMPVQVVPPMYRMLADEIQWALDDNEPYQFSHFLFISRAYRLSPEEEQQALQTSSDLPSSTKRQRKPSAQTKFHASPDGIYSFHPEDECIMRLSAHHLSFQYSTAQPREQNAFGLDTHGRIMLMEASKVPDLIRIMTDMYAA